MNSKQRLSVYQNDLKFGCSIISEAWNWFWSHFHCFGALLATRQIPLRRVNRRAFCNILWRVSFNSKIWTSERDVCWNVLVDNFWNFCKDFIQATCSWVHQLKAAKIPVLLSSKGSISFTSFISFSHLFHVLKPIANHHLTVLKCSSPSLTKKICTQIHYFVINSIWCFCTFLGGGGGVYFENVASGLEW